MAADASAIARARARGLPDLAPRCAFVALLASVPLLPHLNSDLFVFPAVWNGWVCIPIAALFLLALLDQPGLSRWRRLDLIALASFAVALTCEGPTRTWPVLLVYPPLVYLGARMVTVARRNEGAPSGPPHLRGRTAPARPTLPLAWLVIGVAVLAAVHIDWGLAANAVSDVGQASVQGALKIVHGRALYGPPKAPHAIDPHFDTYGPFNYEAYVPFATVTGAHTAARLATVFFDLLAALLLFALGCQSRGRRTGVVLAFGWLAFPLTFYEDALGFNDSLLAAAVIATLLAARSPVRRGALGAAAAWTKLSPLALVALLGVHRARSWRMVAQFAGAFALTSAILFVPVLAHSSVEEFVSRTIGFQAGRAPLDSLWWALQGPYARSLPWLGTLSRVLHGLLIAVTAGFLMLLTRVPGRDDPLALAAACAAVLIALELCVGYWSYSYILWFAPLVLFVALGRGERPRSRAAGELEQGVGDGGRGGEYAPRQLLVHGQLEHA